MSKPDLNDLASLIEASAARIKRMGEETIQPDPDYDFKPAGKKGAQCGQCGMKFDYGKAYGFCCQQPGCPMGMGGVS